ncbi:hypothetical protein ACT453_57675, partial [Bacillus sp. D-CC]
IQGINPTAKLIEATNCEVDIPSLLQIQTFKTKDTLQIYPHKEHNHLEGVKSFVHAFGITFRKMLAAAFTSALIKVLFAE